MSIQTDVAVKYLQTRVDALEAKMLALQQFIETLRRAQEKEPLSLKRPTR